MRRPRTSTCARLEHRSGLLRGSLKVTARDTDRGLVNDDRSPLGYLNRAEQILLGWLVCRLFATGNPRFQRALAESGPKATARMACVNALRLYAIVLFVLGSVVKIAHVTTVATGLYLLAAACMAWSFWCLYTVVGPERAFKQGSGVEQQAI
jgi:hypothetical protein